jgi:HPt (histidine-containing phosphotransfer) domain-containing protein
VPPSAAHATGPEPGRRAARASPRAVFEPATLRRFGTPAEVNPVLGVFLEQLAGSLDELEGAVATGDLGQTEDLAHRVAGSAAIVGARQLAGAGKDLCAACRTGESAQVAARCGQLRAAAVSAQAAIAAHLARPQ